MKAKIQNARLASRLGNQEQWRMRGPRRNRFQGGIIKKKILDSENFQLSSALARMYNTLDLSERGSSVSVGITMDDRSESPIVGGWIRRTHVSEQNRRSPIFTERFYRRDECFGNNESQRPGPHERPAGDVPATSSRPSISQRLGPRVNSPQREQFEGHNSSWSYHKANRDYGSTDHRYPDNYYSRDEYSPEPQRSQDFHQSPANYRSSYYNPDSFHARDPRPSQWPQRPSYSDYPPGYPQYDERTNGDYRRRDEDDNYVSYSRDEYSPPPSARRSYRQSLYYPPNFNSPPHDYMMDQRQKVSRADQPMNNYSGCPQNYHDPYYEDERQNQWSSYSNRQMDDYNSNMAQQRSHSFRQHYAPDRSNPRYDSVNKPQQPRPWNESQMPRGGAPGPGKQGFYQERFSDEDFSDSDQLESETEENQGEMVFKKEIREKWKNLVKEWGVLVTHIGESAEMTKEYREHVKKSLMEKAKNQNILDCWRPRFLRSGLVHRTGLYQLICQDYQTLLWVLQQEIPPLEGHAFSILKRPYDWDCGPVRINIWLPSEPSDQQATLDVIEAENPGIGSSRWRLVAIGEEGGWRQFVADVSSESALYLEKNGWTILFWTSILPVTRMSNVSKSLFDQQEDHA